jgi:peptide/nickel transport system substrate-binding protein
MLLGAIILLLGACAQPSTAPAQRAAAQPPAAPRERPTLTLPIQREPTMFNWTLLIASESSNGLSVIKQIPQNLMTVPDAQGTYRPQLAARGISVDDGTWRTNADGTMDTTWTLRPNIRWQDGVPFTSDDLLFSFTVYKDPALAGKLSETLRYMESASAPDPQTFTIHWSHTFNAADRLSQEIDPLARHLFEPIYQTDKSSLRDSPLLGDQYVGLGAYRLVRWDRGASLEFAPFDDYYLGSPAFGRVIVQVIPSPTTLIANVLAGSVDALVNVELSVDDAVTLRDRWQGTGNQVLFITRSSPFDIEIQRRPEIALPVNGPGTNLRVRQALMHGMDREVIAQAQTSGLGPVADSWILPNDPARRELAASIPQFPYDPTRAQQLLAEAGWVRDASGTLKSQSDGSAFAIEARADVDADSDKLMASIGDYWKTLGAQVTLTKLSNAQKNDNAIRARFPGVHGRATGDFPSGLLHQYGGKYQASAETGWLGGRTGYNNPRVDDLLERYQISVGEAARNAVMKDLLQEMIGDLGFVPLYWPVEPAVASAGLSGVNSRDAWNFQQWKKE